MKTNTEFLTTLLSHHVNWTINYNNPTQTLTLDLINIKTNPTGVTLECKIINDSPNKATTDDEFTLDIVTENYKIISVDNWGFALQNSLHQFVVVFHKQ